MDTPNEKPPPRRTKKIVVTLLVAVAAAASAIELQQEAHFRHACSELGGTREFKFKGAPVQCLVDNKVVLTK